MSPVIPTEDNHTEVHTHSRRIEFENAAPVLLERRYSHGGKEFLPDSAAAKWNHGESIDSITVYGAVLKKDRTTGQQRSSLNYLTPSAKAYGKYDYPSAPEWLLELFADSRHTEPSA